MEKELFIYCILLMWKSANSIYNETRPTTDGPAIQNQTNLSFAEGGVVIFGSKSEITVTEGKLEIKEKNLVETSTLLNQTEYSDLLKNGTVKPRKGVGHLFKIFPRKGAPPCQVDKSSNNSSMDDIGCSSTVEKSGESVEETSKPNTQVNDPMSPDTGDRVGNISNAVGGSLKGTPQPQEILHLKPTITFVPKDSDKIIQSLSNERNVVIPVVALTCAPLVVLLVLLIRKRYQETRGNSYYERMGFLIDDIYND